MSNSFQNKIKDKKNTTLSEQFQTSIEKSQKESKSIPLPHTGLVQALQYKVAGLSLFYWPKAQR